MHIYYYWDFCKENLNHTNGNTFPEHGKGAVPDDSKNNVIAGHTSQIPQW